MIVVIAALSILVAGSVAYCALAVVAARNFLKTPNPIPRDGEPITIMKPLFGADDGLEENLRSFFTQDYAPYEVLLAVNNEADWEATVARRVMSEYPSVSSTLVVTGPSPRPNGKVFSLQCMMASAKHDLLVMSDSDIRVSPDMLKTIAGEFVDPRLALATCPYQAIAGDSIWSKLEAVGMNTEFFAGVLVARMLNGMDFAVGCTLAVRRGALERIGGLTALQHYLAEDFMMGKRIAETGAGVILSKCLIEHRIGSQEFWPNWQHRLRWCRSTRRSRPAGYAGEIFTNPIPLAFLLWAAKPAWWPVVAVVLFVRAATARAVAHSVLRLDLRAEFWALLPLQDLLSFAAWLGGFFGDTIDWRGRSYKVRRDGTL